VSNIVEIKSGDSVNVNVGTIAPSKITVSQGQTTSISIPNVKSIGMSDAHYVHTQNVSSATWTINHGLNKKPSVTVVDSAKRTVHGQIEYIDNNSLQITFKSGFKGEAYLN
jgi:hypothetical protein